MVGAVTPRPAAFLVVSAFFPEYKSNNKRFEGSILTHVELDNIWRPQTMRVSSAISDLLDKSGRRGYV